MGSKNGYTLIELTIIISIISILVAFAIPIYKNSTTPFCSIRTPSKTYKYVTPDSIEEFDNKLYFKYSDNNVEVNRSSADIECDSN